MAKSNINTLIVHRCSSSDQKRFGDYFVSVTRRPTQQAVLNALMVNLRFSHGQWRINKRLEHSVDAEDDPVTGGDIELLDGGGAEAGPHGDALAVDVVQAPSDRELATARILQLRGALDRSDGI